MAELLITFGWIGDLLCLVWLILIVIDIISSWIPSLQNSKSRSMTILHRFAIPPVNMVRWSIPTMYRGVDFAPWITIIALVLIKTFACRAIIYWGMLHRS